MSQITPQLVKELREKTGAGMGDCKNALIDSDGDMQKAIEILRKKGAASAAKRADRSAKEGIILAKTSADGKTGIVVEVNCETDFVARNAEFDSYASKVADAILGNNVSTIEDVMNVKIGNDSIGGIHNEILAKFSENINVRRFDKIQSEGFISSYIHAGNKLAVLVEISEQGLSDNAKVMLRDIAMQIAAMNPQFIDRSEVSQDVMDKEKEIYTQQAIDSGKNPEIASKIAIGKLEKFYQEQCLVEQTFVKDPAKTINDVVKAIAADCGKEVKIKNFRRYFLGEE